MRAEGWWSARTAHVHLFSDGGRDEAIAAARRLEALHDDVAAAFYRCGPVGGEEVIEVTVLSHDDEYDEIRNGTRGFALGPVSALVSFPGRIVLPGSSLEGDGRAQVFAHEMTHLRVSACFPMHRRGCTRGSHACSRPCARRTGTSSPASRPTA
jgi:hypothetical protein